MNNTMNHTAYNNNTLENPAILTDHDLATLQRMQQQFTDECGKNVILVAYKD